MSRSRAPLCSLWPKPRTGLFLAGVGALIGCSLSAPGFDEYAQPAPAASGTSGAGGSSGTAGAGNDSGGAPGPEGGSDSAAGSPDVGGRGGDDDGGAGGGAGAPEEPDLPAIPGQTVDSRQYVLDEVVTRNFSVLALLTSYDSSEAQATAGPALPLFRPFDGTTSDFWDYVVGEQLQARVNVVALPTRGAYTLNPTDMTGPGNMNPRRLTGWADALTRGGGQLRVKAYCLVDAPYLQQVAVVLNGSPAGTKVDVSLPASWNDLFWLRAVKPWFDSVPQTSWWELDGHPVIQLSDLPPTLFVNRVGNLGPLINKLADDFTATYKKAPSFVLDSSWLELEPALATNTHVIGKSPALVPATTAFTQANLGNYTTAVVFPGGPSIPRRSVDPYGNDVVTLQTALAASASTRFTLVQGLTNLANGAGLYRSDDADWMTPNQYLHLLRRYSDLRTKSLRLEAEACDRYDDSSAGNSGMAFRREGDLDVRRLQAGGWAVTTTAAEEWLEFDGVDFSSGNYRVTGRFSTNNSGAGADLEKRLQVLVDGKKLTPIIVPDSVSPEAFGVTLLGQVTLEHGQHDVRIRFMDGFVDLDWIFLRKVDPVLSLVAANGKYASAYAGGGGSVRTTANAAAVFEQLTFDDLNGGSLEDGDDVHIQVYNGLYLSAPSDDLRADQWQPTKNETFRVVLLSGDAVAKSGSTIALRAPDGVSYVTRRADDELAASAPSVGEAETFTITVP